MPKKSQPKGAVRVFYSYSHRDKELRDMLETHLTLLRRRKVISSWHDRRITAGEEWAGQIDEHLRTADIILLLVSANFLASNYCYDIELKLAMKRHRAKEARVIPVILKPCDMTGASFRKLQALPTGGRPVTRWPNRDEAFTDIANGIRAVAEELKAKRLAATSSDAVTPDDVLIENVSARAVPKPVAALIPRPPVVGFVARRDKEGHDIVGLLREELSPDKRQLVALWGPGGSGKTTLAVEAIGATRESFDGRVVWASSLNHSDFGFATLLDEIATQLGREDLRRLAPEHKAAQVAALVSKSPTLVILDNFETVVEEEQTRCLDFFTQNAACSVLITTRGFVNRDDVINVELDAMEMDEAREFLGRLIARTPKKQNFKNLDQDDLIQKCEANPLLLQWVVRQIVLSKTPQTALEYLSHGEPDAAERVFTRSFNLPQLGDDGRAALLALSLFTPSASRQALAEVSGFGDNLLRLDKAVENLSSLWLVETTEGNERLFLRGLTRELAKSRLTKDGHGEEFQRRCITYFQSYAAAHASRTPEDLDALEAEKDNVLGGMDAAFEMQDWNTVMLIRIAVDDFLSFHGYWADSIRSGRQAGLAARKVGSAYGAALFANSEARIRKHLGEYDEAEKIFQTSLKVFRSLGHENQVAVCLHWLGGIAEDKGELEKARRLYDESLEISKILGQPVIIASTTSQIGIVLSLQGKFEESKVKHEESLAIRRRLNDQYGISVDMHQLGNIAFFQGDLKRAQRLYSESLEIAKKLGNQLGVATTLNNLGEIMKEQGDLQEARRLYQESLDIGKRLGDQNGIAITLHNLGRLAEKEGNKAEAAQFLREALRIYENLGLPEADLVRRNLARMEGE